MTLGSVVKSLRTRKGLSLRQAAKAAGISPAMLSRIENGLCYLTPETAAALSGPLGKALLPTKCAACPVRQARTGTEG